MDIRDEVITGSFMIGNDGRKEPINWRDYALKLEAKISELENVFKIIRESGSEVSTQKEWISVINERPDEDTWVLAYSEAAFRYSKMMICLYSTGSFFAKGFQLADSEVTHWQPLPDVSHLNK